MMKIDFYTKTVLTLLLIVLAAMTARLYSTSAAQVFAAEPRQALFLGDGSSTKVLLDTSTGQIWEYRMFLPVDSATGQATGRPQYSVRSLGRLVELGKPIEAPSGEPSRPRRP